MQYKNVLEEMRLKKGQGRDLMTMSRFVSTEREKVGVCTHPATEIGSYHTHDFFEVNYVCSGTCINLVEEQYIDMKAGDLILLHTGSFHTLYAEQNCEVYNFLIEKRWFVEKARAVLEKEGACAKFLEASGRDDFYKYLLVKQNENTRVKEKAEKLIEIHKSSEKAKNLLIEGVFLEFLASLISCDGQLSDGRGESSYKMITLLTYLMNNYDTVSLNELSKKFYYSKTHICRMFLKNTGKTFNQTLIDVRLANAEKLLKTTDITIEAISRKVGYESNEYFQRLFKKKTGISPGDYRKQKSD